MVIHHSISCSDLIQSHSSLSNSSQLIQFPLLLSLMQDVLRIRHIFLRHPSNFLGTQRSEAVSWFPPEHELLPPVCPSRFEQPAFLPSQPVLKWYEVVNWYEYVMLYLVFLISTYFYYSSAMRVHRWAQGEMALVQYYEPGLNPLCTFYVVHMYFLFITILLTP